MNDRNDRSIEELVYGNDFAAVFYRMNAWADWLACPEITLVMSEWGALGWLDVGEVE